MKTTTTSVIAVIAALAALAYLYYVRPAPATEFVPEAAETRTYASPEYGIAFSYSPGYYLKERNTGTSERPQLSLVLVEDTTENRDVIEGRTTEPRDGPPAITVDVYPNPDQLPAEDWVHADTNWTIRTSEAAPVGAGSITGVTYSWSGLYEGKSVVVTEGARAYVFSVSSLLPEDAIRTEFERILGSVVLTP